MGIIGGVTNKGGVYGMPGDREEALLAFVDKYLDRGWIQPSQSEWAAQAFVVPKPKTADGEK